MIIPAYSLFRDLYSIFQTADQSAVQFVMFGKITGESKISLFQLTLRFCIINHLQHLLCFFIAITAFTKITDRKSRQMIQNQMNIIRFYFNTFIINQFSWI